MTLLAGERERDRGNAELEPEVAPLPDEPASRFRPPTARTVIGVVAGLFVLMYVVVALLRLRYPYELEWIEGGMVNHVEQVRSGHSLYAAPSLTFTADIYTPLYFIVSADTGRRLWVSKPLHNSG